MKEENIFWVVVSNNFPTRISYRHDTYESAKIEAQRLARNNKGEKFLIMKSIEAYEVEEFVKTKYVVNFHDYGEIPF